MRVGFTFQGATLDGAAGARRRWNRSATACGSGSATPTSSCRVGEHRYVIRYRTTRQLGRFDGYDELYWNATGNGWQFPIDVAEARIRLPSPRRASASGRSIPARRARPEPTPRSPPRAPGDIASARPGRSAPYEGLTVAVAFPKGVVAEPGEAPGRCGGSPITGRRCVGAPRPARPARFLLRRLEARRPQPAGRNRRAALLPARRPDARRRCAM